MKKSRMSRFRKACPFTEYKIWHGPPGTFEVVYVQVKQLLDWKALELITQDSRMGSIYGNAGGEQEVQTNEHAQTPEDPPQNERQRGPLHRKVTQKVIMGQGPWCDEEMTIAWERYMQTEGLSQHVCCQYCDSNKRKSQSPRSSRTRWSNDDSWSASAHTAGVSQANTTVKIQTWTSPSSSNLISTRASFIEHCPLRIIEHCPMRKKNILERFEDR